MWYTYTVEYDSAIKKNSFLKFLGKRIALESIILSGVTQSQKNTYGLHSLINESRMPKDTVHRPHQAKKRED